MEKGQTFTQKMIVLEKDTALNLGSGGLQVFGTPALIAFMENTALQVIQKELPKGSETVGMEINTKHLKASPIGAEITCTATITNVDGRKISYEITACDAKGDTIGTASHDRFIVDAERFMNKLIKG